MCENEPWSDRIPSFAAQLRELGYSSYEDYLRSPHWARIKKSFKLSSRPQCCSICGDPKYQLHHKTYERLGRELLMDLEPLCQGCHALVHQLEREGSMCLSLEGFSDIRRALQYRILEEDRKKKALEEFLSGKDPKTRRRREKAMNVRELELSSQKLKSRPK